MAVDNLVDSSQLDADLTSVANAIRTKGGTSASLAFPADFVSAIGAIPTGGGGYDYDIKKVNVTGNSPTVDRAFDNFVFIAEVDEDSVPAAYPGNLYAFFLMFAYVDGQFMPINGSRGYDVSTNGTSEPFKGGATSMSSASVGATSITFTAKSTHNMYNGSNVYWNVVQIELPSDTDIYSFYNKSFS